MSIEKSTVDSNFTKKDINFSWERVRLNQSYMWYWREAMHKFYPFADTDKEKFDAFKWQYSGEFLIDTSDPGNEVIIGWTFVLRSRKRIQPIYVNEKYRGYGFGSIMLNDAVTLFNGNNVNVHNDNEVAIRMYKNYGFTMYRIKKAIGVFNMKLSKSTTRK